MDGVGSKFDWTTKSRVISDIEENEVSFFFRKKKNYYHYLIRSDH